MRTLFNLLIATGLLLVLNAIGWLTLSHNGAQVEIGDLTWPAFGSVLLVAVILWLVSLLVGLLYVVGSCLTLGVLILAYPFAGWATLKLTEHFMPGSLSLHGFWITVLCGLLLMIVKIHPRTTQTRVSES